MASFPGSPHSLSEQQVSTYITSDILPGVEEEPTALSMLDKRYEGLRVLETGKQSKD